MDYISVNDYRLHYSEAGQGEPVIFIHGSVSDYRTWSQQQKHFSERYRTISYSRRFHYPNERISEDQDYDMDEHAFDLAEIIRSTGSPAHLIGHSYGAFISLLLASKSPGSVKSMVLSEPPFITLFVSNKPMPGELLKLLFTRPGTALSIMKFGAAGVGPAEKAIKEGKVDKAIEIFGQATLGKNAFRDLSPERKEQVKQNFIEAEFFGSGFPKIEDPDIRKINMPVLLLEAEQSPPLFHHILDRLEELLPDARRSTIPDASHILHEDNPDIFNKTVLSFLSRHAS